MSEDITYLVDHAHNVVVSPSTFVKIVRLLQHLAQSLRAHVTVSLGPPFDGRGQEGVAESESAGREAGGHTRVGVLVVATVVAFLLQDEVVPLHNFFAQDHGQEFVVGDVLDDGGVDVTSLLEQGFIVPVRVDDGQLAGDQVVVTDEDGVDGG